MSSQIRHYPKEKPLLLDMKPRLIQQVRDGIPLDLGD
jgi:hypothetical protein